MLRLTSGSFKGRSILTPAHLKTRPTQAKLRQALFNSIQAITPEARVLDLFAGSGSLGFEALSRGASEVVFVEISASVAKLIEKNAESLGVMDKVRVLVGSIDSYKETLHRLGPFDLVLADPPYGMGWELKLIQGFSWDTLLSEDGVFCFEWGEGQGQLKELPESGPFLVKIREKHYGDSRLTTFKLKPGP